MPRRNEYTGEICDYGHAMYIRVVTIPSKAESRRGPTCWLEDCPFHRRWQELQPRRRQG